MFAFGSYGAGGKGDSTLEPSTVRVQDSAQSVRGNYDVVQLGQYRRDQFLIDRRSGRIWQSVCSGEVSGPDCKGMQVWEEMFVSGVTPASSPAARAYFNR